MACALDSLAPERCLEDVRYVGGEDVDKSARNERRKLTAAFFNAVASGTVLAAMVVPLIGLGLGTVQPSSDMLNVLTFIAFGLVVATVIHLVARDILKRLEE